MRLCQTVWIAVDCKHIKIHSGFQSLSYCDVFIYLSHLSHLKMQPLQTATPVAVNNIINICCKYYTNCNTVVSFYSIIYIIILSRGFPKHGRVLTRGKTRGSIYAFEKEGCMYEGRDYNWRHFVFRVPMTLLLL